MIAVFSDFIINLLSLAWLTGPLFDKELRVSSRRSRNYSLRSAYILLLAVFVAADWANVVRFSGNMLYQKAQMASAGKSIVTTIVFFQFIAAQVIAIIMLSTAISDEITSRTLGVLMTTPITSFQIVMGKLFSKLLQIILLLAISLPLLAIVRILGGIELVYILSSLCITLTAVIFAGSLSLFFSIFSRKAYVVIILTVITLGILFGLLTLMPRFSFFKQIGYAYPAFGFIIYLNPYLSLAMTTDRMLNPRFAGTVFFWPIHCVFMLAASSVILSASIYFVRMTALAQIAGQTSILSGLWRSSTAALSKKIVPEKPDAPIRPVKGPPVVWKEMISRLSSREKIFVATIIAVELIMIAAIYIFPYAASVFGLEFTHTVYFMVFMGLGLLSVIIFPATCITSEKEARTWPLLLTTTLTDWQILIGKSVGVLRRTIPAWLLLFIYLIPFWDIMGTNIAGVIQFIILILVTVVFLCCSGLYFSSRFRHTNTATLANFLLAAFFGITIPYFAMVFMYAFRMTSELRHILLYLSNTSPLLQAIRIMFDHKQTVSISLIYIYIFLGIIFIWLAKRRIRREVF
jgi:ABC-type transport system involved in multi-copper enzyme maturation permease subunit